MRMRLGPAARCTPALLLGLLATGCSHAQNAAAASAAPTRSWIHVDASCVEQALVEGQRWEVPVEYYLDPPEHEPGMTLYVWIVGPWIDCPDGKYATRRQHIGYPGMSRSVDVAPGLGRHTFVFTVPPALPGNRLLIICYFRNPAGERWPWEVRCDGGWFRRSGGFFELETDKPGNLFTYDEPVQIVARLTKAQGDGIERTLACTVWDTTGTVVAREAVRFTAEREGQEVPISLSLQERGTFLLEAEVDGWEGRRTTFCRIPDVLALTGGGPTPFGMTNVVSPGEPARLEEMCLIARRLGLTSCRAFVRWSELEPGRGVFRLDAWERALETGHKHGIETWLCLWGPPAWVLRATDSDLSFSYRAFRCDLDAWREFMETATTRLKERLYGWEWLNEITPGGTDDPVGDYVALCRVGTETAKRVAPNTKTILAGGLWPRSFRLEMLRAGVGKYVDVLPIHYSNGDGVREARADLDAAGLQGVAVWDDESAKGVNAWDVPPLERLADIEQANWVLTQWTDELAAGCERIIYFGGDGDPCGNYSYLLDDLSPRPVAATLAVFTSKLFGARPVGVFSLGKGGLFHLFDRAGQAVLVCSTYEPSETVRLPVGTDTVRLTDYQGNEQALATADGVAELQLVPLRYFLEGGDLDVLKAQVVPAVVTHTGAMTRTRLMDLPKVTLLRGAPGDVKVQLTNHYGSELAGSLALSLPTGWPTPAETSFSLRPGEQTMLAIPVTVPGGLERGDYDALLSCRLARAGVPEVTKPLRLSVTSPEMLGNLLPNGDFETPDAAGQGPEGWRGEPRTTAWGEAEGLGDGLGRRVLRFTDTGGQWSWYGRSVDLRGGQTYLYTAWVWNRDMHAGSNVTLEMADGSSQTLYDVQVFTCGENNPYWQLYACHLKIPEGMTRAGFTPVARGSGSALFDNLRVTFYEGTDFAAEACRAPSTPRVDGNLDDWTTRCPLPLIGRNQLTVRRDSYAWTPDNLNALAYLMWDDDNLYVAVRVRDDVHDATQTGDDTVLGDSVVLGLDPTNRSPEGAARAFAYYLSAAAPGGGSGAHTLFRPADRSAGLRPGQLAKDSSVYEVAVARSEGLCVYELRLPFSELGGLRPGLGGKLGFSIQVNDGDGQGLAAHMNWGEGLHPSWAPANFGVVTLVE